ncbi:MAG: GGDEF domain-containing protein [Treponema sp.]|nr:GGDEF domain-containing protein [Treponema sp.]
MNKLRYYNFSKEEILDCNDQLRHHNLGSLSIVSLVNAMLILVFSFYPRHDDYNRIFYYAMSLVEILLFISSFYSFKKGNLTDAGFNVRMGLFLLSLSLFCIFIYIVDRSPFVVRFLLVFLNFQIIFIIDMIAIILINITLAIVFYFIEKYSSVPSNDIFDIYNIILSAIICLTLNWYASHIIVKGIITSNSLKKERNRFLNDSIHDQLTGLNNRRSFEQSVDFYTSVCRHVHQTVCIVMMDVDFFKNYNDFYGHIKGDLVLQAIGSALKELSEEDRVYVARVGGEEFIVLWTENRMLEAERIVLKLRQKIIDLKIPHEKSAAAPYITASFGLYFMRGGSMDSTEELYNYADVALYKAKEAGRNCIILLDSSDHNCRPVKLRPLDELKRR